MRKGSEFIGKFLKQLDKDQEYAINMLGSYFGIIASNLEYLAQDTDFDTESMLYDIANKLRE